MQSNDCIFLSIYHFNCKCFKINRVDKITLRKLNFVKIVECHIMICKEYWRFCFKFVANYFKICMQKSYIKILLKLKCFVLNYSVVIIKFFCPKFKHGFMISHFFVACKLLTYFSCFCI